MEWNRQNPDLDGHTNNPNYYPDKSDPKTKPIQPYTPLGPPVPATPQHQIPTGPHIIPSHAQLQTVPVMPAPYQVIPGVPPINQVMPNQISPPPLNPNPVPNTSPSQQHPSYPAYPSYGQYIDSDGSSQKKQKSAGTSKSSSSNSSSGSSAKSTNNHPLNYSKSSPTSASPPGGSGSSKSAAKRSRMGCITCRQRKKRCCETRPKCTECSRLRLNCVWPVPGTEHKNKSKELKEEENVIHHEIYGKIKVLRGIVEYKSDEDPNFQPDKDNSESI